MIILVTGGARSGKSRFAEQYASHLGTDGLYVATSEALDEEMQERISMHQLRRQRSGFAWETVEEPLDLAHVIKCSRHPVILVDCLTLWLSNWLLKCEDEEDPEALLQAKIKELTQVLTAHPGSILLVSNEVGSGIVPEYSLGRLYRDLAGMMNQQIAAVSDQVFLVTAGIPVELKSLAFRFPERLHREIQDS